MMCIKGGCPALSRDKHPWVDNRERDAQDGTSQTYSLNFSVLDNADGYSARKSVVLTKHWGHSLCIFPPFGETYAC